MNCLFCIFGGFSKFSAIIAGGSREGKYQHDSITSSLKALSRNKAFGTLRFRRRDHSSPRVLRNLSEVLKIAVS